MKQKVYKVKAKLADSNALCTSGSILEVLKKGCGIRIVMVKYNYLIFTRIFNLFAF